MKAMKRDGHLWMELEERCIRSRPSNELGQPLPISGCVQMRSNSCIERSDIFCDAAFEGFERQVRNVALLRPSQTVFRERHRIGINPARPKALDERGPPPESIVRFHLVIGGQKRAQ